MKSRRAQDLGQRGSQGSRTLPDDNVDIVTYFPTTTSPAGEAGLENIRPLYYDANKHKL